jgi:hypothetical protein
VTGTPCGAQAATTASTIASASASSCISAEPAHLLHTLRAGQPMLMSMICAPRSMFQRAASAISRGSVPAICTAIGPASPLWSARRWVFTLSRRSGREVIISLTAYPAPKRRQSWRNGRSVTPAIGATNKPLARA